MISSENFATGGAVKILSTTISFKRQNILDKFNNL
jgi:hypothetical protein